MFACRLANRAGWLGSIDDLLDLFTPEEFDERLAAEEVDGSPPEWIERLAAILKLGFASMGMSKVDPELFDPLRERTQPIQAGNPFGSQPVGQTVSPNQAAAMFAMAFGPPR